MPDATPQLRFGVVAGAEPQAPWQMECLEHLARRAAQVSSLTAAELQVDAAATPALVSRLRVLELDFLLCFADGPVPAALLEVPRHGVWRFHWGDWTNYRGAAPGYWEVYDGSAASAALLLRVHADADLALVLRQGFLRTQRLSATKNLQQLQQRFAVWPADVCRELGANTSLAVRDRLRARRAQQPRPSRLARLQLSARLAARVIDTAWSSLFRHDQWNIGILEQPIAASLTTPVAAKVRWLPPTPRAELRADPFGTERGGRSTLFCEYFSYEDNQGYIVAMDLNSGAVERVDIGPQPAVHLSYPALLEVDGALLCMPESSAAREVALYEFAQFPHACKRVATLLSGAAIVDATLFQHEGRWWMAGSDVAAKGANSELHLWHAPAPHGPWSAHAGNPVKTDVRSARPAGTPFTVDGVLYRPAQDCSSTYGARVVINRVVKLSPDEFREEAAASVGPDPRGPYPRGLHTLSALGAGRTLIDGKRSVFVPAEFLRILRHYLA